MMSNVSLIIWIGVKSRSGLFSEITTISYQPFYYAFGMIKLNWMYIYLIETETRKRVVKVKSRLAIFPLISERSGPELDQFVR